jgi:pyrroline-5-carboxylate reductase
MNEKFTLGIIGAGNMASAIVGGVLKRGLLSANEIVISDSDAEKLAHFAQSGVNVTTDNIYVGKNCDYILFAVKPQIAPAVLEQLAPTLRAQTVISIMAGVSIAKLERYLGKRNYARIMPNTPALIGEGMAAVAFGKGFRSQFVLDIFNSLGKAVELDESLFDAVTSVSGSGPAYVYLFIKAMIDGGTDGGLDYQTSKTLTLQTVLGAAKMIENSDKQIDLLIDAVCSKGGTTIQAIDSFRADGLEDIVKKGMEKCRLRSEELGK